MFPQFSGQTRQRTINLSGTTSTSASSTTVLARARAERVARESARAREAAAGVVQRVWRGRREAGRVKRRLAGELLVRPGQDGWEKELAMARRVMVIFWAGVEGSSDRVEALVAYCQRAVVPNSDLGGIIPLLAPLPRHSPHLHLLALIARHLLSLLALSADTPSAPIILETLTALLEPRNYAFLGEKGKEEVMAKLVGSLAGSWVECLVKGLESLPKGKKKHPSIPPIIRLLTVPLTITPLTQHLTDTLLPALIHTLLPIPSLPSLLPLPSLTHLCLHLPLFPTLFPLLLAHPQILSSGRLSDERAKTELLANLVTLVVRGGMLDRVKDGEGQAKGKGKEEGVRGWMGVVMGILAGMGDQWGLWIEGRGQWAGAGSGAGGAGSGDDEHGVPAAGSSKQARIAARGVITPDLAARLIPLLSSTHLSTVLSVTLRSNTLLPGLTNFILALLNAFRGSPRYEGILDGLLQDHVKARGLTRSLWMGGVRGRWTEKQRTKRVWEGLFGPNSVSQESELIPPLLLLSELYVHTLITLPDDEFFATASMTMSVGTGSLLSLDEVIQLAGIWRDLGFYGYWGGVGAGVLGGVEGKRTERRKEDVRGLMTRGVVAVSARDARRRFTPSDFWIMTSEFDLPSFVEAVCLEERQLETDPDADGDVDMDDAVALARQPPPWMRGRRQISKRQMAFISPRLGLLNNLPGTIPFETRVEIFQQFIHNDREKLGIDRYLRQRGTRHRATIRRGKISEDGFRELDKLGPLLKGTVEVQFIDEWGQEEAGIDGGGLFKEFLTALSKEAFDTDRGLWLSTPQNELYPNPHSYAKETHQLSWYSFIGRVLGKALYEDILVDVSFASFFLAKWLGRQSYLDDLASLDKDLYKGLVALKNYPGDPEELSLNFTVAEEEFGVTRSLDLVKDGSNIAVTQANRTEYIQLVCDYKLNKQIAAQCQAFFSGLSDIIDPKWLRMFDQQELQTLVGGTESPIDVEDLRRNAIMPDGADDISLRLFWKVVGNFTQVELKALLKFVTSCARPPLLGFGNLQPKFGIRLAGNDTSRLPSASACANLLKL